jgi:hypothetical protein
VNLQTRGGESTVEAELGCVSGRWSSGGVGDEKIGERLGEEELGWCWGRQVGRWTPPKLHQGVGQVEATDLRCKWWRKTHRGSVTPQVFN